MHRFTHRIRTSRLAAARRRACPALLAAAFVLALSGTARAQVYVSDAELHATQDTYAYLDVALYYTGNWGMDPSTIAIQM